MTQLRCRIMVGLVLLLGTAVSEVRGDDDSLVGSRVRVRTGHLGGPQVGVLEGATPGELVIKTHTEASPMRVRRADVVRLEVSRGTRRHTLRVPAGVSVGIGPAPQRLQAKVVVRF